MISATEIVPRLRSHGFRVTTQRMAILQVLSQARTHLAPMEIYQRAQRAFPGLTEPTVYRTLATLSRSGLLWQLRMENGHLAYELAGKNHNHLVCGGCGEDVELKIFFFEDAYTKVEAASGYVLNRDHLTLSGLCPNCQRRKSTSKES